MRKGMMLAMLFVLVCGVLTTAKDGITLGVWPDDRAPYAFVSGEHTLDFGLGLDWEFGLWWYREDPPTGYSPTFTVATVEPSWTVELFNGWECEFVAHVQYRTNRPGRVEVAPRVALFHSW